MPQLARVWAACIATAMLLTGSIVDLNQVRAQQPPDRKVPEGGEPCVALLVNAGLAGRIRLGLNQFSKDLGEDGYTVYEKVARFTTPPEARSYLSDLHKRTGRKLVGAILIGDHPRAYQLV